MVSYTHDTKGNRTSRTVGGVTEATWSWDDLSSLPVRAGEYDQTGSLTTAWLTDPTSTTGAALAENSGGVSSWLLSDPSANITAAITTTGSTVSGTRTMDAFGVTRATATGSLAGSAIGFAGQYLESATGLYDMRARDYDPHSGRFTANDTVAVPTGMPYIAGYSYSFNNPLTRTDASGNWSVSGWAPLASTDPTGLHCESQYQDYVFPSACQQRETDKADEAHAAILACQNARSEALMAQVIAHARSQMAQWQLWAYNNIMTPYSAAHHGFIDPVDPLLAVLAGSGVLGKFGSSAALGDGVAAGVAGSELADPSARALGSDLADATGGTLQNLKSGYSVTIPSGGRGIVVRVMDEGGGRSNYYRVSIPGKQAFTVRGEASTDPALTHIPISGTSFQDILSIIKGLN